MKPVNIRIAIDTLGCKINQAESEQLSRQLAAAGYRLVSPEQPADIYILNTCTVTHIADRKSRHRLRLAHRRNPNAALVVTGCYAERAARELTELEGISLVINNSDKHALVRILAESGLTGSNLSEKQSNSSICQNLTGPELPEDKSTFRTRTFIKVQDGCHNFCAYCIVPFVRRNEECLPPGQVIQEIRQRQTEGYQEIVITGVEVGSYRSNDADLRRLLAQVLQETDIPRIRLSSLQPQEITPELVELWGNPRLCRHFHIALQSGSETVLRRMNRQYTGAEFAHAVALIRSAIPEAAITTDIIVGFPGETQAEFAESYEFCKKMDFARIHVFPYSARLGTRAAALSGRVNEDMKKTRTAAMLVLGGECVSNFSRNFLNQTLSVLFEQQEKGFWSGLTDNYIRVYVESADDLTNRLIRVRLQELFREGLRGEPA